MFVILEFFGLVIRRDRIAAVLPGGWDQFVAEHGLPFEGWWDDDLVRFGAMNGVDLDAQIADARALGSRLIGKHDGREVFKDMCIVASPDHRLARPCNWIGIGLDGTATFIGNRRKPRRPRITARLAKQHAERTLHAILAMLAQPPADRTPMPLDRADGAIGTVWVEQGSRRSLVVDARADQDTFRWAEDVVTTGWEVSP